MTTVRLGPATTRSELRDAHLRLAEGDGGAATLVLEDGLHSRTPAQFSAWVQAVFTWGQDVRGRTLEVSGAAVDRFAAGEALSDVEVFAAILAETIISDGVDVTAVVQPAAREILVERDVLTSHDGDGAGSMSSLLLAAHTFSNRVSPELHARSNGSFGIEESARTLYHDIWPSEMPVRQPLLEFGEEAVTDGEHTYVTRRVTPDSHPHRPGQPFTNLGSRAPQIRGVARDLATRVRVQAKPLHDEVGELLFELVQNTEWHAVQQSGGRTGANCRALSFREYTYDLDALDPSTLFDPNFASYVGSVLETAHAAGHTELRQVTLGSVTIVDSGVGLARSVATAMGEDDRLNASTEIGYLIKALSKHLKRRRAELGNIGLARVQLVLTNLNGFMSVRTGSVEILRNFVTKPFDFIDPAKPHTSTTPLMVEWIPADVNDFVAGPRLGTAVTIVYPVDFGVVE